MSASRLLLLAALPALLGVGAGSALAALEAGSAPAALEAGPAFLPARRVLAAPAGGSVALACRVQQLGDKAVSWVRARDLRILAHAGQVFSADPRVRVEVSTGRAGVTHTLRLAPLRAADAGRYECQLNTEPKLSQIYNLTVTEGEVGRVEVSPVGAREVRGAAGGAATLGCSARLAHPGHPGDPPALALAWYKDGTPLLPQSERAMGGVSLDTERAAGRVSSRLTLATLAPTDAGRYTCRVSAGEPGEGEGDEEEERMRGETTLTLIVLEDADIGEMEAMQRDQSAPGGAPRLLAGSLLAGSLLAGSLLAASLLAGSLLAASLLAGSPAGPLALPALLAAAALAARSQL